MDVILGLVGQIKIDKTLFLRYFNAIQLDHNIWIISLGDISCKIYETTTSILPPVNGIIELTDRITMLIRGNIFYQCTLPDFTSYYCTQLYVTFIEYIECIRNNTMTYNDILQSMGGRVNSFEQLYQKSRQNVIRPQLIIEPIMETD